MQAWEAALEAWVAGLGEMGVVLFVAAQLVATLLLIPHWIFAVAAGALFGVEWGFLLIATTSLLPATAAFLIARHGLRGHAEKLCKRNKKLHAIDRAIGKQGWKGVALLRMSPLVPFGVKNYFFGCTDVKLSHYLIGTALGKIPGELLFVSLGATGRVAMRHDGPGYWILLAVGFVATIGATWLIGRAASRRLGLKTG